MPKTKLSRVEVRMTPEEKENLKNKAEEAHMTVSKYIVYLSETKRVILKDDIAKLTVEITRIGSDINDIAYIGNYQKFVNRTQLEIVSRYLQQIIELQKKILAAMFSEEDADAETTMDIYAEATNELKKSEMDSFAEFFRRVNELYPDGKNYSNQNN